MKTEIFIMWLAFIGLVILISVIMAIRKMVIRMLEKKNCERLLSLPPGKEKCEWEEATDISELYPVLSSDLRKTGKSKAVHRFVR